jgi:hypothetical protein
MGDLSGLKSAGMNVDALPPEQRAALDRLDPAHGHPTF